MNRPQPLDPVLRVQSRLTGRDLTLLGWLADHGVLTSDQIATALYPSINFAQRRLRTLLAIGVVDRFRPQRADGGSYPYHYVLGQLGADVIAAQRGEDIPRRDHAKRRRWHLTNRANLPHLLGVNRFFTDLAGYARTHPDHALDRWWPARQCQQPGAFAEPGNIQALAYPPRVRPDGHGIWTHQPTSRHPTPGASHATAAVSVPFFVEYDTGTEPLGTLIDKLTAYGELATVTGAVWPVLFWLHSSHRERNLHQRLTGAGIHRPVATAARDTTTTTGLGPAEAVWWLHRHPGPPRTLTDLTSTVLDLHHDPRRGP